MRMIKVNKNRNNTYLHRNNTKSMHTSRSLFRTIFLITACAILYAAPVFSRDISGMHHRIDMSFDLSRHLLRATSRIELPAGMPLVLECGPLSITAAMVEPQDQTFRMLYPGPDNTLHIQAADAGQRIWVSYELQLPEGGSNDNLIEKEAIALAGFWHPRSLQKTQFTLIARIPENFTAVSEAFALQSHRENPLKVVHLVSPIPLHTVHLAAAPYRVRTVNVDDIALSTYFFPEDEHLAQAYLEKAAQYLSLYRKEIGPYPYSRYAIVENVLPTGYGFPGFTLLGRQVVRLPFIRDTSLGHEILHSWFGNSIFVDSRSGNWAEGLTSYLADHLYAVHAGEDAEYRKQQILRYNAYFQQESGITLRAFQNSGPKHGRNDTNRAVGYNKGTLFFHMLSNEIGEETFQKAVRQLYREHVFSTVSWNTLEQLFSRISKKNLHTFFNQWLDGKEIAKIELKDAGFRQSDQGFSVEFTLAANDSFQLSVPVEIVTSLGRTMHTVRLDEREQTYTIAVSALPLGIAVDPHYDLMRRLTPEETPPLLARLFAATDLEMVVDPGLEDNIQPMLRYFKHLGAVPRTDKVGNRELQERDWIFIGNSAPRRSLFGAPSQSSSPICVEMHTNPLNPEHFILTVDIEVAAGIERAARILSHYQKYSLLGFVDGRVRQKAVKPSEDGIRKVLLPTPTAQPAATALPFNRLMDRLGEARVVYVGESHDDYSHHLLQLQIIQALHAQHPNLVIGLEMFPATVQPVLDDYIQGVLTDEAEFVHRSGYHEVWGYDYRLYRDIFTYARRNAVPLIGLNLPRNVPGTVFRTGSTDALDETDQHLLPTSRSLTLPGYGRRLDPYFEMHQNMPTAGRAGFIQAQAIWDETMAENIGRYLKEHPTASMVVLAGTGHVNKLNAIPPRVSRRTGATSQLVVVPWNRQHMMQSEWYDFLVAVEPMELPPSGKLGIILGGQGDQALTIEQVSPHGKANQAGMRPGDIIRKIRGTEVNTIGMLRFQLMNLLPGDRVEIELEREENIITTEVELTAGALGVMPPGHPR